MPVRSISRSTAGVRIVVEDQLVPEDVVPVRRELASADAGLTVEVDLRRAGNCQPNALLMLAQAMDDAQARPSFRGLTDFDRRLLRYLGRTGDPAGAPPG